MLVAGQTFCLADGGGALHPGLPHGLFVGDTRVLSHHEIRVDGLGLEHLGVAQEIGSRATFVGRTGTTGERHRLLVVRRRTLDPLLIERIEIRSHDALPHHCEIRLDFAADFGDLFSVKQGRVQPAGRHQVHVDGESVCFTSELGQVRRMTSVSLRVHGAGSALFGPGGITWSAVVPPHGTAAATWQVDVAMGGEWIERSLGPLSHGTSTLEESAWIEAAPRLDTDDPALVRAYRRAVVDLASLRLFDPARRRLPVVAAGAPWFMTLFGRDSLWTSLMALPVDPTLALGVLDALAELQGEEVDARSEEEPGRIMHETRFDGANTLALEGGTTYYGSVDATPLFVVVLGELARWGLPEVQLRRLLPHADRALAWAEQFGDRDGDGYVEYQRANPRGLVNQGWKDSWDAVRHRDGSLAQGPIALAEVQGYLYAAYQARADMARMLDQEQAAATWLDKASLLRSSFNRDFWVDELGWFAMALDRSKQPVSALASNMGHCLWSGIVDDERAALAVERLGQPSMWTGWGLRTLAADEVAFDATSYHCGSVWPHDSTIAVAGVARYGHTGTALRMVDDLLAAADRSDGRLPELFLGLDRGDIAIPVPYPTSCSPQAWSAAAPLLLLRVLLGLDAHVPDGVVRVEPTLPPTMELLDVKGLRLWDSRFDITCKNGTVVVEGLPEGIRRTP
jgi:glycogen debranching enzyme